jgi:hypothetical protein
MSTAMADSRRARYPINDRHENVIKPNTGRKDIEKFTKTLTVTRIAGLFHNNRGELNPQGVRGHAIQINEQLRHLRRGYTRGTPEIVVAIAEAETSLKYALLKSFKSAKRQGYSPVGTQIEFSDLVIAV